MSKPLVSVIIPTYNSEKTLPLCLESIKRQTYKNIEVIIVDNFSVDRTVDIAKKYGVQVHVRGPERSAQMNYGALSARGELVYFIGSDFVLHSKVIEECVQLIKQSYDAVIVLNVSYPKTSLIAKIRFYERLSYYGSDIYEAARFMKRSLFMKVGGFDEKLYANEDYDLHQRLLKAGARIARTKRSFEIHIGEPKSVKEFIIRSIYYGQGIKYYVRKNPNIMHITPIRPTFFKREYLAYVGRNWLPGLILVPLFKIVQAIATQIGMLLKLKISPYHSFKKRGSYIKTLNCKKGQHNADRRSSGKL